MFARLSFRSSRSSAELDEGVPIIYGDVVEEDDIGTPNNRFTRGPLLGKCDLTVDDRKAEEAQENTYRPFSRAKRRQEKASLLRYARPNHTPFAAFVCCWGKESDSGLGVRLTAFSESASDGLARLQMISVLMIQ